MQHFANFGIIKQQNKYKKRMAEVQPRNAPVGQLENQLSQFENEDYGLQKANRFLEAKRQNYRAKVQKNAVDPLTYPYTKELDWTAKQSFGDVLKKGLKTKPVRKAPSQSILQKMNGLADSIERYEAYPKSDPNIKDPNLFKDAVRVARLGGGL
jgi:hypothetical protein